MPNKLGIRVPVVNFHNVDFLTEEPMPESHVLDHFNFEELAFWEGFSHLGEISLGILRL